LGCDIFTTTRTATLSISVRVVLVDTLISVVLGNCSDCCVPDEGRRTEFGTVCVVFAQDVSDFGLSETTC